MTAHTDEDFWVISGFAHRVGHAYASSAMGLDMVMKISINYNENITKGSVYKAIYTHIA